MTLFKKPFIWVPAVLVALVVAWWLGSPLFLVSTVDEPPPMAADSPSKDMDGDTQGAAMADDLGKETPAAATGGMGKESMASGMGEEPMVGGMGEEPMAGGMGAEPMAGEMSVEPMASGMGEEPMASNTAKPAAEQPMMSGLSGAFHDADSVHKASGTARVIEVAPGHLVLRFEDFMVTNGPDLFVVLTRPGAPAKDGVRLGALKGSQGSQNYELPAGVDLADLSQVVIWCRAFNVTFGTADLAQP